MKKRSLFVATAMLLVAVLVATGATYAWFTNVQSASADLSMAVASGESLEFSIDGGNTWHTSLEKALEGKWSDFSVTDDNFANSTQPTPGFFTKVYDQETNTITGYVDTSAPVKVTINFRASKAGSVLMSGNMQSTNAAHTSLDSTLRLGAYGADYKQIFANPTTTSYNAAIADAQGTTGTQTWVNIPAAGTTGAAIVDLALTDDYYTGVTEMYFWVEGPLVFNSYTNDTTTAAVALTFAVGNNQ